MKLLLISSLLGVLQFSAAYADGTESIFQNDRTKVNVGTEHFSDCNPILPLWEHIPDGEPHVFEDSDKSGKYRVYLYGSHDTRKDEYCGTDLVVWSAPLEDLSNWRYDGVIYANNNYPEDPRLMFAPDVAEVTKEGVKRYYLYPNEQRAPRADVAIAESPKGPFVNMGKSNLIGFDPAILVDDDGRVYAYWGFNKSYGAELDPTTMCTLKPGTKVVEDMVSNRKDDDSFGSSAKAQSERFRFFEASSIRKIDHMYVFVYSRFPHKVENRGGGQMLAYAYSTNPLGPWTYGGPIITSPTGNIHGGLAQLNGEWYIFYHRDTNKNWFSRQACVEPVKIEIKGNRVKIDEVPCTSMGFNKEGLNPYKKYPAAIACQFSNGAYAKATYDTSINCNPVVMRNKAVVGYKYYNFDVIDSQLISVQIDIIPKGVNGSIDIMIDNPFETEGGIKLGTVNISSNAKSLLRTYSTAVSELKNIKGKRAVYLVCKSEGDKEMSEIYYLKFTKL